MQLWSDTSTEETFYRTTLNMPYGAECWATEKREVKAHIEELRMLRLMLKEEGQERAQEWKRTGSSSLQSKNVI